MRTPTTSRASATQELKEFDKAIAVFKQALEIDPLHASAEFALARALQRSGNTAEAQGALQALPAPDQHQDRRADRAGLWRAGPLLDGDAGRGAGDRREGDDSGEAGGAAVGSRSQRDQTPGSPTTGGACMMDVTGSGQMDLVLMQTGRTGDSRAAQRRRRQL